LYASAIAWSLFGLGGVTAGLLKPSGLPTAGIPPFAKNPTMFFPTLASAARLAAAEPFGGFVDLVALLYESAIEGF
jgi:hypothetical protein